MPRAAQRPDEMTICVDAHVGRTQLSVSRPRRSQPGSTLLESAIRIVRQAFRDSEARLWRAMRSSQVTVAWRQQVFGGKCRCSASSLTSMRQACASSSRSMASYHMRRVITEPAAIASSSAAAIVRHAFKQKSSCGIADRTERNRLSNPRRMSACRPNNLPSGMSTPWGRAGELSLTRDQGAAELAFDGGRWARLSCPPCGAQARALGASPNCKVTPKAHHDQRHP